MSTRDRVNIVPPTESPVMDAEIVESIRAYFHEDRSRMTMMAARKFGVPEQQVVETLVDQWPIVRLGEGSFRPLLESLADLGPMRVFVRSRAAVIEAVGIFGGLSETGPFLNVQTDTLDMHIMHEEIGAIFAVEKWGHDTEFVTHSFQFFDRSGDAAFKAFVWDGFPNVPAERIETFRKLTQQFADKGER